MCDVQRFVECQGITAFVIIVNSILNNVVYMYRYRITR